MKAQQAKMELAQRDSEKSMSELGDKLADMRHELEAKDALVAQSQAEAQAKVPPPRPPPAVLARV